MMDKKLKKYLVIGSVSAVIIALLFSGSLMNMFTEDNSVEILDTDNSVMTITPSSHAVITIWYADVTKPPKVIESVDFVTGILSPASQSVFENGEEIAYIDMAVSLSMENFEGNARSFEVYYKLLLRIENNAGQTFEHEFLVNKANILVTSDSPVLIEDFSFTVQEIEDLASLASSGTIDGSYTLSTHYELAVEGKVLSGYASMPIKISTLQETTVTGGEGSVDIVDSGIQPDQTYDEYVASYEEKVQLYGLIDYHLIVQQWQGEKDAAGNFVFVDVCTTIQILNEPSDIAFHESIGAIAGAC